MAPRVVTRLATRDDTTDSQSGMSPTIIAGIIVAAVIGAGVAIWLTVRWYRKRAAARRNARRGSAFASYTGFDASGEKSSLPSGLAVKGTTFSRERLNSDVVMPERAVLRPGATREEILEHYSSQGSLPRPFAPFQPNAPEDLADGSDLPSPGRHSSSRPSSGASWIPPAMSFGGSRDSRRMSAMSTASSIFSTASGTTQKKVRQIFDPVLPDELVVSLGETLTLVQSFDDGWCIAGRDSVFKPGEVELGAVPGWCFVKPVKGLRAERPMRVSSLGVTVNLDAAPAMGPRNDVMSWSNF